MKKVLSLALALMMLLTLCITPVMAAEADGSQSNPYYVANPMAAPGFITIPANSAVYYQYKAAVFSGWEVGGYGLTSIVVDGVVYNTPDMWGEVHAPLNFNPMSPGIVAYVNDTAEDVQVMLTHNEPLGTESNPDSLADGINALSIPASNPSYVADYIPSTNGEYTFECAQTEDFIISIDVDGTSYPLNQSLTLELESYIPVRFYISPIGVTGEVEIFVVPPKAGTAANPIWVSSEELDAIYYTTAGEDLYISLDGAFTGNTLTIESVAGANFTALVDGVEYASEDLVLSVALDTTEWYIELILSSAVDNEFAFTMEFAPGSAENPLVLENGDNTVSIPAGKGGYYYNYVVESDGLLILTPASAEGISYLAMADASYDDFAYLQEGASSVMMPVTAGEIITVEVYAAMDEDTFDYLALETVLTVTTKELVLFNTFEDGDMGGWSTSSVLTADDVDYASGWYSAKFEAVADWANMFNSVTLKANTDYVISFKAKAALEKGAWIKFNDNWKADIAQADVALTTEWADYEVTLNSGNYTNVILMLQYAGYGSDGQIIWIDDMLVTAEPTEEPDAPELPEGTIYYDGFENGIGDWATNSGATVETVPSADLPVANPNGGNNALKHVIPDGAYPFISNRTPVTVEPNTNYVISIDALNTSANWPLEVKVGTDYWFGGSVFKSESFVPSTTQWGTYTFTFNSGDNTQVYFGMKSQWASSTVYFDNYLVYKADEIVVEPEEEVEGNLFVNGTFEDGNADGWKTYQGSAASTDAAKNGSYGFHAIGNGSWGAMINQTVAVEVGKSYKLSFWVKVVNNGVNIQVKDANDTKFDGSPAGWYDSNKFAEWTYVENSFVAHADTLTLNVCGAGNGTPESAYLDSITLVQLPDPSFDGYITNGDFETGELTGWTNLYGSCGVEFVKGYESDTALSVTAGNWQQVRQNGIAVEPNTDYTLSVWYKDANNFGFIVKKGDDSGDINNVRPEDGSSEWKQATLTFNSGDQTSICVLLIGWEGGGSAIVDNVTLTKAEKPEVTYGDANGDGNVNNKDLGLLQQYLNEWEVELDLTACDVNGDGSVNNKDLGLLQQYLNDWDVVLG